MRYKEVLPVNRPRNPFGILQEKIADKDVLWLIETIIGSSNPQGFVSDYFDGDSLFTPDERRKGLPIGNLTSQFFGNVYMNGFDHYIKDKLGCRAYLRYVDDFAVFSNSKEELWEFRAKMDECLGKLRLKLHNKKTRIFPVKNGCEFLGFYIYPNYRRVKKANIRMFEKKLNNMKKMFGHGLISLDEIKRSIQGWIAHAEYANSYRLRERIFVKYVFVRRQTEGAG